MREFAAAGGEMIIHAASHSKNTPTPELVEKSDNRDGRAVLTLRKLFLTIKSVMITYH